MNKAYHKIPRSLSSCICYILSMGSEDWREIAPKLTIESLRIKHKLTIRGLAALSGVSKSVVGDISIGIKTKLSRKQTEGFCKAFNCGPGDLYKEDDYCDREQ